MYEKPWLSLDEQTSLLLARGMAGDPSLIKDRLSQVGYYRLSGYAHIFKNPDDTFRNGTTIEKVWDLYTFDRQLRLTALDAIERIEVYLRSQLAYCLAEVSGPFGYLEKSALPRLSQSEYLRFLKGAIGCFSRSREPFAQHFKENYGDACAMPPYWILLNTLSFSLLKTLYTGAPVDIRNRIAHDQGISARVLDSWLLTINTARNICAHHSRLWNRPLGTKPMIPRNDERWHYPCEIKPDRIFGTLTILCFLLNSIAPQSKWKHRVIDLLQSRSQNEINSMGFSDEWRSCPFWQEEP